MLGKDFTLRVPTSCRPDSVFIEKNEITESIEEYCEGIFRLQEEAEVVSTGDLARYMCVKPASVTMMIKRLIELELVEHMPYQGVLLTDKGVQLSISLLRKHRLIERLLVDYLDLPWDDVHELACKLEHYVGDKVTDKIAKALNYPETCPHGNPIDATKKDSARRLSDTEAGESLRVVRISDERQDFLIYVKNLGLMPGVEVEIIDRTPFGDVLTVRIMETGHQVAVGKEVGANVWLLAK